jgi:hypothetical protein
MHPKQLDACSDTMWPRQHSIKVQIEEIIFCLPQQFESTPWLSPVSWIPVLAINGPTSIMTQCLNNSFRVAAKNVENTMITPTYDRGCLFCKDAFLHIFSAGGYAEGSQRRSPRHIIQIKTVA